jgi:nucleoside-diphosphate-sugar epimerase
VNTVAQFADAIASGEAPELFGDGSQTRDFTHLTDVTRACELAERRGADRLLQRRYRGFDDVVDINTWI